VIVRVKKGPPPPKKEERKDEEPQEEAAPPAHAASSSIPAHITQILSVTAHHKRPKKIMQLLPKLLATSARLKPRCVVFFAKIDDLMATNSIIMKQRPEERPYSVATLHGKQHQDQRNRTLADFRAAKHQLLLTTDVMGRGLDVKGLE
jgi:superfamily II DNA/RNA helicase